MNTLPPTSAPQVERDVPECAECERLFLQRRAALLSGDRSRGVDLKILTRRHVEQAHTVAVDSVPQGQQEREQAR